MLNTYVYVKNRFIEQGGRLISNIQGIGESFKKEGYLLTVDIKSAFDSVNRSFLIPLLKRYGFGNEFLNWFKVVLKK